MLAGLDRWATDDASREKAETARQQVVDTAAQARALAVRADQADDYNLAASLRAAAAETTAKGTAVDASVRAFQSAAMAADHAAEMLEHAISEADAALRRRGRDDQAASAPDNV